MSRRRSPGDALRVPQAIAADVGGTAPRGSAPDLAPLRRIAEAWPAAVGEQLAQMAQPARIAGDGTLIVHARDASWTHALTLEERRILARLAELLGDDAPRALKVEVGVLAAPAEAPAEPAPEPPSAEALRRAEELTREVADPRLRDALRRLAAQSLERRKSP